jgi:hypothetical protein
MKDVNEPGQRFMKKDSKNFDQFTVSTKFALGCKLN